jgi:hypothetical protein
VSNAPRVIKQFKACQVWIWHDDYLETRFPKGLATAICPALFDYGAESSDRAKALGYGEDSFSVRQMHLDHELAHTFLAEERGLSYSPTLAHVAGIQQTPDHEREEEEGIVCAFQCYLTQQIVSPLLDVFDDVYALAQVFNKVHRVMA